ncbi:hypothetical protein ALC56_15238 [Trachymyrmex septentrionalis]|uniref:Uncharacterized protein n=1 Tax=Trachymyrmex septentrionalis TaxID=34720 RepID=A0A195ERL4_9HYME|nr:hypothetical protein ALC56_15238 [Trachymyrmex septentrionalis]
MKIRQFAAYTVDEKIYVEMFVYSVEQSVLKKIRSENRLLVDYLFKITLCSNTGNRSSSRKGISKSIFKALCGSFESTKSYSSLSLISAPGGLFSCSSFLASRLLSSSSKDGSFESRLENELFGLSVLMKISFMSKSSESELSEGGSFIQESKSKFSENSPQIHAAAYKTSDIVALGWPVKRYEFSSNKAHC